MDILNIKDVVKKYSNKVALNGVSLDIKQGSIFGLLGPNGAGKTSLIRIITTITQADSGEILFCGRPLNEMSYTKIGYLPEERGLYKKMKVEDQLLYLAQLKDMKPKESLSQVEKWLGVFDIRDWKNKKIEELSKGMQQKIQFIATVQHQPILIILDEPFSGLDPINAAIIKEQIQSLKNQGVSIILSTHRMEQVEEMCDEIALINEGNITIQGNIADIKHKMRKNIFKIQFKKRVSELVFDGIKQMENSDNTYLFQSKNESTLDQYLKYLLNNGNSISSFEEILPTINQIFIENVQKSSHK